MLRRRTRQPVGSTFNIHDGNLSNIHIFPLQSSILLFSSLSQTKIWISLSIYISKNNTHIVLGGLKVKGEFIFPFAIGTVRIIYSTKKFRLEKRKIFFFSLDVSYQPWINSESTSVAYITYLTSTGLANHLLIIGFGFLKIQGFQKKNLILKTFLLMSQVIRPWGKQICNIVMLNEKQECIIHRSGYHVK